MNSRLDRARSFLLGRCKSTALRVLPLALLAISSMEAAPISTVTISNVITNTGSTSIFALTSLTGSLVKFAGNADVQCPWGRGSSCMLGFSFQVLNNQGPTVQMDYDFLVSGSPNEVYLQITNGSRVLTNSAISLANQPGQASGSLALDNGTVDFYFYGGDFFSVTVPSNSIDFSPAATNTAVPEPSTMAMALAGAAALAVIRRRRK